MSVYKRGTSDQSVIGMPKKFVTLYASGAITAGDCVAIDTGVTTNGAGMHVEQCDVDDSPLAIGIARDTAADGATVVVQVAGYNDACTAVAIINLGDWVGSDTGTDGNIQAVGGTAGATVALSTVVQGFALCVDAFTAGAADGAILIYDHGYYG